MTMKWKFITQSSRGANSQLMKCIQILLRNYNSKTFKVYRLRIKKDDEHFVPNICFTSFNDNMSNNYTLINITYTYRKAMLGN
jgi:hypothetical protein